MVAFEVVGQVVFSVVLVRGFGGEDAEAACLGMSSMYASLHLDFVHVLCRVRELYGEVGGKFVLGVGLVSM